MYFPPEENENIGKDGKTIIKTRKRAKNSN